MPTPEEKAEIERKAYDGELALPEITDFFRNCGRDFQDDPIIEAFRDGLRWMGTARSPGRLLDVGPGTGIFLHLASKEFGWEPVGIDICEESAVKAREEFEIELDVGDFQTYDWEPESFDAVTMLDMLEHTIDPTATLHRAQRLLRPGGILYLALPNQNSLMTVLLDVWMKLGAPMSSYFMDRLYVAPHVYYFSPKNLRTIVEKAGFEVIEVRTANTYHGRYELAWWMRLATESVLRVGQALGMGAKVLLLARKPLR